MGIKLIVARGENGEIGAENKLLWKLPTDMDFFKKVTMGSTVIMGRKTWESIGKPLKGRVNIVLSRTPQRSHSGMTFLTESAFEQYLKVVDKTHEIYIIGGAKIYEEFASLVDMMYITDVEQTFENADTFFKEPEGEWIKTPIYRGFENGLAFTIRRWERITDV